jgi:hypothetical protein
MIPTLQRQFPQHVFMIAVFLFCCQTTMAGWGDPAPVLKLGSGSLSEDGHVKIVWEMSRAAVEVEVEVQQSKNENFEAAKTVYRGLDKATFVSGLENGTYHYRIRHVDGAWSDPVMLTVRHHSLRLAFILFSLGAVVFAFTVFIVVRGARQASVD